MKKALSLVLALVMVLALIPATAMAAEANPWTGHWTGEGYHISFWQDGENIKGVQNTSTRDYGIDGTLSGKTLTCSTYSLRNGGVDDVSFTISADGKSITGTWAGESFSLTKDVDYSTIAVSYSAGTAITWTGLWEAAESNTSSYEGPAIMAQNGSKVTGYNDSWGAFEGTVSGNTLTYKYLSKQNEDYTVKLMMAADGKSFKGEIYKDGNQSWFTYEAKRLSRVTYVPANLTSSDWAKPELARADSQGLIPDGLKTADLTKPITRAEFAAVAVKVWENLTGKKATAAAKNPFTDTKDAEVLKAYNVGITSGTAADKFSPNVLLNREQAATMLCRVLKGAYIPGWTLPIDSSFTLNYKQPAKFADDAKISDWAKPSVYFMAANGIISGTGNNNFSPRATTAAEEAVNYASATREQAVVIGLRLVENLKDKPLDYTQGSTTTPTPTPAPSTPTPTPSTPTNTSSIVGKWSSMYSTSIENSWCWIEFKSDGTFYFHNYDSGVFHDTIYRKGMTSDSIYTVGGGGTQTVKGNYQVSGDKIYCTNLLYSFGDVRGMDENIYTDEPGEDTYWLFYLSEFRPGTMDPQTNGHEWLCINMYPNDSSRGLNSYIGFQIPED